MTITVLSPYRVFFVDEAEKLWTVLKDGRLRLIKSVPSFSCVSAKHLFICGVAFDGEHTTVLSTPFGFGQGETQTLFTQFGYYYYPSLLEAKHPLIGMIKADLLNSAGTGDLIVYQRARTKYHPKVQLNAKIVAPVWHYETGQLYYITAKGALARTDTKNGELLAQSASLFCLSPNQKEMAFYDNDCIYIVSLETGNTYKLIAFDVTALSFSLSGEELYFAATKEGAHNIYVYDRQTMEVSLLVKTVDRITFLTY